MISNDTRNNRLNEAAKFAQSKKGKVILKRIFQGGVHDKITYCCQNNHEFQKTYHKSVNKKEWCKYWPCNKSKPQYRDQIGFSIFKSRLKTEHQNKIICISKLPNLPKKKLEFRCKVKGCDEIFFKSIGAILCTIKSRKRPPGCPSCARSKPITEADVKKITEMFGIKVTSKKFFDNPKKWNAHTKLPLECPKGHKIPNKNYNKLLELKKAGKKIVCNKPSCNPKYSKYEIEEVHILAKKKGVIFKDKSFDGNDKLHNWECVKDGHDFPATLSQIRKNAIACNKCQDKTLFNSISKIQNWLSENEPTITVCPGEKWVSNKDPIKLRCSQCEEITEKLSNQILKRSLCRFCCSKNRSELIVMQFMRQLFPGEWDYNKKPFEWLINSKDNKMELDGYCPELKLAFEHHGRQHYEIDKMYCKDNKALIKRRKDDEEKERLCNEHGIKIIIIQELNRFTIESRLKEEIKNQCNGVRDLYGGFTDENLKMKYKVPKTYNETEVKIYNLYYEETLIRFEKAKLLAEEHNQIIKTKEAKRFITVLCNSCNNERKEINLYRYLKGPRCRCNGSGIYWKKSEDVINFLKKLAKKNNAEILTKTWDKDWKTKLKFKCKECAKNKTLIQPVHSEYEIVLQSLKNRFHSPLKEMKLRKKTFHPQCGHFKLGEMSLGDVKKYIKRFEPTAEILITSPNTFIPKKGIKYTFRCSNKRHPVFEFTKNFERISEMRKNNSFGCKKCGQYNRKR